MLKKLLKYDFKYIFKFWWIAAVISFGLSFVGGGCITILRSQRNFHEAIDALATLTLVLVGISFTVFAMLTVILNFARFYKNFFTDEGYLTFTLPVKCSDLISSKLIVSTVSIITTGLMVGINVLVMLCLGFADEIFTKEFFNELSEIIKTIFNEITVLEIFVILEALVIGVLSVIFTNLFIFCCITIGSVITKKAKVITSIAIYYGSNMVFSFAVQIFMIFCIPTLSNYITIIPEKTILPIISLFLLVVIFFAAVLNFILYTFQYWMIDRKLNLS